VVATVDPQSSSLKLTPDKGLPLSIWTLPEIVPDPDGEVLNPTMLLLSLPRVLHEMSVTEVVILTLKVVAALRLLAGVMVKIVSLSEATGAADILMQVVKLSDDNWKLPEQFVSLVFVVRLPVAIFSLNVTATVVAGEL
jgi:hypothetical protein